VADCAGTEVEGANDENRCDGWAGLARRTVVAVLSQVGRDVVTRDATGLRGPGFVRVAVTNYGETIGAFFGENDPAACPEQAAKPAFAGLVHLAAIPAPGILSNVATFHNNMPETFMCSRQLDGRASGTSSTRPVRRFSGCLSTCAAVYAGRRGVRRSPGKHLLARDAPRRTDDH
jgi:hypothetical protein